jgi:pyruvate-formate lyase-activating enzyme
MALKSIFSRRMTSGRRPEMIHFASILFSGPCNLQCPFCIGRKLGHLSLPDNLSMYPVPGLEDFLIELKREGVREISFSGTGTDPQLYRHEEKLIRHIRVTLGSSIRLSLHTNALMAVKKIAVFNLYDRACLSIPSFNGDTYRRLTGSPVMPPLEKLVSLSRIPLKLSVILCDQTEKEIPGYIRQAGSLGIKRIVYRQLFGSVRRKNPFSHLTPLRYFLGNPVYHIDGVEVTLWNFESTDARCLNLLSNGHITEHYLLEKTEAYG